VDFGEQAGAASDGVRPRIVAKLAGRRSRLRGRNGEPAILRLIAPLALLLVAATVVCWVLGLVLARQADDALDATNRQALRGAVDAVLAIAPDPAQVDVNLIRILERASGLKGLRFDADPPDGDREVQSLTDANGRIVGWFSWQAERPATATVRALSPFAALIAVGLLGFAITAMWQLRKLSSLLASRNRDIYRLAYEDVVTGLANLHQMRAVLDEYLSALGSGKEMGFALIDLGGFDELKDAVGDGGEDEILVEIANRLRATMPEGTIIARLRGDKFGLVMPDTGEAAAVAAAQAARDAISRAIWVNQVVQVSANVGLVMAPRDGSTREALTRRGELALRTARRRGIVVQFSAEMETEFDDRRFIKRELSRALAARSFEVHYQPIVKADSGAMVGVEALVRWNHPSRGYIAPSEFVRVAEEAGVMDQLGEFVLRRALSDAERWPDLYVSVNLSPVQVRDRRFVDLVATILAESGINPKRLVLEVTEGILIDDPLAAKARLEDLRRLGVSLALDDFGSGYSSLGYLQQLPFDKLKIDRGFVAALDRSANTGVIIQAIVALGRALGMSVLIEGVETEEQRVLLRLAGCNEMQGYLFARPGPREEIDRILGRARAPAEEPRKAG
jgi:diguanylate cyclase (GGDEF)-like protein